MELTCSSSRVELVRFESAGASALHTLHFGFNQGDATRKAVIVVVVVEAGA